MGMINLGRGTLPDGIVEAFERLTSNHPEIETVSAVGSYSDEEVRDSEKDKGAWSFSVRLKDVLDKSSTPIVLEFRGDSLFPWSEVGVFTKNYFGLPHQRLRDGKLCLDTESVLSANATKLEKVYQQALQWLTAASEGRLAKTGEPYEYPDFDHGLRMRLGKKYRLLYAEDGEGFEFVHNLNPAERFGRAKIITPAKREFEVYLQELFAGSNNIRFADSNWPAREKSDNSRCVPWVVVNDIDVENHRPPVVWPELHAKIRAEGIDVESLLKTEWRDARGDDGLLLVGWLMPLKYGESVSLLAWRLVSFASRNWERNRVKMRTANCRAKRKAAETWSYAEPMCHDASITWCPSNNIGQGERLIRGRLAPQLQKQRICIVGCGALGAQVAELLVRGGCTQMVLVDSDSFEYGNLCRHTLTVRSASAEKAFMLSARLKLITPNDNIIHYSCSVPGDGSEACKQMREAVRGADLVIDCSGDVVCGMWLSQWTGNNKSTRGVRAFMSGAAEYLTLCLSGRNKSLRKVELVVNQAVDAEPVWDGMDWRKYKAKDEIMVRGGGCWSATYPGSWVNITMFAGVIVNRINEWVQQEYGWEGEYSIYECNSKDPAGHPLVLVRRDMC